MTRSIWRIAADTPAYVADDLSGAGAKISGGRWNEAGLPMVYTSESRALACLETFVHLNSGGLPLNRYLVEIVVPDAVEHAAERQTVATLAIGWDAEPAARESIAFGNQWLRSKRSLLFVVPSAVVAEESNFLINPAHPDLPQLTARKIRRWLYDPRLDRFAR